MKREIRVYGANWCEDTQRTRRHLDDLHIAYEYVDIDRNPQAKDWVKQVNGGKQRTPTVVLEDELLVEPADADLDRKLHDKHVIS